MSISIKEVELKLKEEMLLKAASIDNSLENIRDKLLVDKINEIEELF